jgi:type IV pilus assembly protein PilW
MKRNLHWKQCESGRLTAVCNGFSLVELMVALVISLILLGAVILIFSGNKRSYDVQDQSARMQENGRYAMEVLMKDIRLAGYWGGNADKSIKTANSVSPTASGCDTTNWSKMISQRIYGLNDTNNDGTTTGNYTACIPTYVRGDVLAVRHALPVPVAAANLTASGLYIISDMDVAGLFTGTTVPTSVTIDSGGTHIVGEPNAIYPIVARAYYIRTGPSSCPQGPTAGQPVTSLYRSTATTTSGPTAEEVVSGVQDFQVQYGVDTSTAKDSSQIRFYDAHPTNVDWANIVAVRVWLLLRALCPEQGYTNTVTYDMGSVKGPYNDSFRRQLFTATITFRN